jgi:hypothetical protein
MMTRSHLPVKQLYDAACRFISGEITVQRLGAFVSTGDFLADRLADLQDPLAHDLADHLETLEEVYAVSLDRQWLDLPEEEETLVRTAATSIRDLTSPSDVEPP